MSRLFLDTAQAAEELGLPDIAVKRLLARSVLPFTVTGNGIDGGSGGQAHRRIVPSELTEYVRRGAPDLALPESDHGFIGTDVEQRAFEQIQQNLREVAEETVESAEAVQQRFDALYRDIGIAAMQDRDLMRDQPLPLSPGIRSMLAAPAATFSHRPTKLMRSTNVAEFMAVHSLRTAARKLLETEGGPASLERLYSSPDEYDRIGVRAYEAARDQTLAAVRREWHAGPRREQHLTLWWTLKAGPVIDSFIADASLPAGTGGLGVAAGLIVGTRGARLNSMAF